MENIDTNCKEGEQSVSFPYYKINIIYAESYLHGYHEYSAFNLSDMYFPFTPSCKVSYTLPPFPMFSL